MGGEWKELTLDQLGRIVTGKTPSSKGEGYFGGTIPFVTPADFDGRRIITDTGRHLTERGAASVAGARIPFRAVMVTCIGSDMGKAAIAGRDCVTNQQINSILVGDDNEPLFVYYNLSGRKAEIRSLASGSAQPILNKSGFSALEVSLPPLRVQQAIACILGSLDDKIELNRRMNRTLEDMARAIFKSWFVDFDPVRAKAAGQQPPGLKPEIADLFPDSFEHSELGEIPKGWRVGSLGMVAQESREAVKPADIEANSPYIALEHIPKRCIALDSWGTADDVASGKLLFRRGDILFGKLRPYFHKVGPAPVDGVCSTDIVVVQPKNKYWYGLVLGHLTDEAFVAHTDRSSTGTKMPRTKWRDMAAYTIAIPSADLAKRYSDISLSLVQKIRAGIIQSRTLASLRETLLPKLISGELRVPDAERIAGRCL